MFYIQSQKDECLEIIWVFFNSFWIIYFFNIKQKYKIRNSRHWVKILYLVKIGYRWFNFSSFPIEPVVPKTHEGWLFQWIGRERIWNAFRHWGYWFCSQDLQGIRQYVGQKAPESRLWSNCKDHIFWEGHKILGNLPHLFVLSTASQIIGGDLSILWPSQNI